MPITENIPSQARPFRPVVVAPTYNNAMMVISVLERIERAGLPMIVVDDGATDETPALLAEWASKSHNVPVRVVTHPKNRGKAAALLTGFEQAKRLDGTHAVTIDTDGQLEPEEIPKLLAAAADVPDALVLGRREAHTPGLPRSHLLGWFLSGLGLWVETGVVVHDSQCGLRVYPLRLFDVVHCRAGRFGFETEIIARALWAGCPLVEVPVTCHYPSRERRISHLKPWRDGVKGFFMHWGLAIRRLIPWPEPELAGARAPATPPSSAVIRTVERGGNAWCHWINPMSFWRQIRSSRLEQLIASASFAHGVFFACMPLGLLVFAAAVFGSKRLHHNLWPAMLGAALSSPPIGPTLAKTAIAVAYVPTHGALPDFPAVPPGFHYVAPLFRAYPVSWCLGGLVLGTLLHWVTIAGQVWVMRRINVRAP